MARLRLIAYGTVQGVGFRPFVYREAARRALTGWVKNASGRVEIEVQGPRAALESFSEALSAAPAPAEVTQLLRVELEERTELSFRIVRGTPEGPALPVLPADLAPCAECVEEMDRRGERRYRYPFIACTRCGPRYSVVSVLPYDRAGTTLGRFELCADCEREYRDPRDRRFHAEAIACPACGPELHFFAADGVISARGETALSRALAILERGLVLALRGVGGFQLLVDAADDNAVRRLRERKRREQKPFALLFPRLDEIAELAELGPEEAALLAGPEAPIVLVRRRARAGVGIAASVAPDNPRLGCMLPSSPLHRLIARAFGRPLVCTSGNASGEPLAVDDGDARARLAEIADAFLSHNRDVARPLDDSIARVGPAGAEMLRRARGHAPRAVARVNERATVLALGAHLKASATLLIDGELVLGQHVGDLEERRTLVAFHRNVKALIEFFRGEPELIACDLHPDYASTRLAETLSLELGAPLVRVQHHHAHVAAVMAEHALESPVLGIAWDGTGLGTDGTLWGGEFLLVDGAQSRRFAHLLPFRLPGGDSAARWPWRSALGLLFRVAPERVAEYAERWLSDRELGVVESALERGLNAPPTSSIGRLFDAVAALLGLTERNGFEGQAAMALEFLAAREEPARDGYPLPLVDGESSLVADPTPLIGAVLGDLDLGAREERIAVRFHTALVDLAVAVAERAGREHVVLSGGCFQNLWLSREVGTALAARGHRVHRAGKIPCNDGGISAGQAYVAALSGAVAEPAR